MFYHSSCAGIAETPQHSMHWCKAVSAGSNCT